MYGKDDDGNVLKTLIFVPQKVLAKELRLRGMSFENTVYEIITKDVTEVPDSANPDKMVETETTTKWLATARQTQFNPGKFRNFANGITFCFYSW